ncbi:MAG TPA: DUF4926 domain-containing protein [Armatimonadota bacterium]|jgi:hypothetical protein
MADLDRIQQLTDVAVLKDVSQYGLSEGAVGTVVDVNPAGTAYEVEFDNLPDDAITITPLPDEICPVTDQ